MVAAQRQPLRAELGARVIATERATRYQVRPLAALTGSARHARCRLPQRL